MSAFKNQLKMPWHNGINIFLGRSGKDESKTYGVGWGLI